MFSDVKYDRKVAERPVFTNTAMYKRTESGASMNTKGGVLMRDCYRNCNKSTQKIMHIELQNGLVSLYESFTKQVVAP